jgi:hypothetical protein
MWKFICDLFREFFRRKQNVCGICVRCHAGIAVTSAHLCELCDQNEQSFVLTH